MFCAQLLEAFEPKFFSQGMSADEMAMMLAEHSRAVDPRCELIFDSCAVDALVGSSDTKGAALNYTLARVVGAAVDSAGSVDAFKATLRSAKFFDDNLGGESKEGMLRRLRSGTRAVTCDCLGTKKQQAKERPYALKKAEGARLCGLKQWRGAKEAYDASRALLKEAQGQRCVTGWMRWRWAEQSVLRCDASFCALKVGALSEALKLATEATEVSPGLARAWSCKGAALEKLEDFDMAALAYKRALCHAEADPTSTPATCNDYAKLERNSLILAKRKKASTTEGEESSALVATLLRGHDGWLWEAVFGALSREDVARSRATSRAFDERAPRSLRFIACARLLRRKQQKKGSPVREAVEKYVRDGDCRTFLGTAFAALDDTLQQKKKKKKKKEPASSSMSMVAGEEGNCARALAAACPRNAPGAIAFVEAFAEALERCKDPELMFWGWVEFCAHGSSQPTDLRCLFTRKCLDVDVKTLTKQQSQRFLNIRRTAVEVVEEIFKGEDEEEELPSSSGLAPLLRAGLLFELLERISSSPPDEEFNFQEDDDVVSAYLREEVNIVYCALHNMTNGLGRSFDQERKTCRSMKAGATPPLTLMALFMAHYETAGIGLLDLGRGLTDAEEARRWQEGLLEVLESSTMLHYDCECIATVAGHFMTVAKYESSSNQPLTRMTIVLMHIAELCVKYRPLAFARKLAADDDDVATSNAAVCEFLEGCLRREKVIRLASNNLRRWSQHTLRMAGYT